MDEIYGRVIPSVTYEMNWAFLVEFRDTEILTAIKEMGSLEASRYDGFPAMFYQNFWHIVREDIS